jgi:hypothetical protein
MALAPRARWLVRAGALTAGLGTAACATNAVVVTPIIDVPADDLDATAAPLDEIALTVAHARSDHDLVTETFAHGETLEVPGVPFGDDLVVHMSGFVGASNVAYGRTCTIAVSPNAAPPTPHLFFSRSVKFASTNIVPVPRTGGLGISYLGTALLVDGSDLNAADTPLVTNVERFDPLTGKLTVIGDVQPREGAVQALVGTSPPRVAVIGGTWGSDGAKFIEVLDDRRIDRQDSVEMARVGLTATSLTDGRVMVIGGNPLGRPPLGDIDEIAPDGASYDVHKLPAVLAHPRRRHSATRLGDDVGAPVLIAGGVDGAGVPVDVAELFKPLSESLASPATFAPRMNFPRYGHTATLMPDGSVLFIGGLDGYDQPVRQLELFSIDAGFVTLQEVLPADIGVIDFTTTPLPDGRILLTGGHDAPGAPAFDSAYIVRLDPLGGSVEVLPTDHMVTPRAGHQALALCDGTILISGGAPAQFPAERYNPPPLGRR